MLNSKEKENLSALETHISYGIKIKNSNTRKKITLSEFKSRFSEYMINEISEYSYYNLLETAVLNNRYDIVHYLLSFDGWNINHQNQKGLTILQYISDNNHFDLEIAQDLLSYNEINTDIVDAWGNNPINTAVFNSYSKNVSDTMKKKYYVWLTKLIDIGFKPNDRTINFAKNIVKDPNINKIIGQ